MRRARACLILSVLALGCAQPRERERGEVVVSQDRRDKEELLARLDTEIRSLDKQIRALDTQEEGRAERDRLWERRELLFGDRNAVQYATEAEWRVVKERAERDLRYGTPSRI
jgi:hypothetical protein